MEFNITYEKIHCIFYGKYNCLEKLKEQFDKYNINNNITTIITKINYPLVNIKLNNNEINVMNILEKIQCIINKNINIINELYILLFIDNNNNASYFSLNYLDNIDPLILIYDELDKILTLTKYKKYIKNHIKLIDMIGNENEHIVFTCKLYNLEK